VGKPLVRFCEGQEKQTENRENKHFPIASGGSCLLEKNFGRICVLFGEPLDITVWCIGMKIGINWS